MFNVEHRPWALPKQPWIMSMKWHDLLFMHWPVSVELLRPLIPASLEIDTYDGWAWLGIVPFHMTGVGPRYIPKPPLLSDFSELNVRTYVKSKEKQGVWFFSLDAANPIAVMLARLTFHLPYYNADMSVKIDQNIIDYRSIRTHRKAIQAELKCKYQSVGKVFKATKGSIDYWLTERYCLYASNKHGQVYRGEIHHEPWSLQDATADIETNTMTEQLGFQLPSPKPLLHFAKRLDVVAWKLRSIA